jgi:hypothetical protein
VFLPLLALALALAAATPDGGVASEPTPDSAVAPVTPRRGSAPEQLPFNPDTIRELVRAKQPEIERCWEQTLAKQDQPVEGRLQTHFVITPAGTVKGAQVVKKGTTLKNQELHRCVVTVLSTLTFPRPPDSKDHPVDYPFNLKAQR